MIENFSKEELNNEQWKTVDGYNGLYEVSSLGRVRSRKSGEWRVLSQLKHTKGYLQVRLYRNRKGKTVKVHRLVAQAFIENTDGSKTQINHIDECKQNNRVSNLEWCDNQYNSTYNGLRQKQPRPQPIRDKIKDLYNPGLSARHNIEIFRENGIECCRRTVWLLRNDLGLTKHYKPRKTKKIS